MNQLIKSSGYQLPANIDELHRFILIGEDALVAHQAKIRAISRLEDAQVAKEAAIKDGQSVGEAVLWAKAKLGEMLEQIQKVPKVKPSGEGSLRGSEKSLPPGVTKKQSHSYQELYRNQDVIREVIAEAIENEDMPTTHETIKRIQKKKQRIEETIDTPPLPDKKYQTLVVDPPWPVQKILRDVRPNQDVFDYPTMTIDEIMNFPIQEITADNAHLYLWTTHKILPDALDILAHWGFKYQCLLVWHKPGGFQPFGMPQFNCEFILFGKKGSLAFLDTKSFPCCFNAARGRHSEKPNEFYDLIQRVSPGPRIDVFARKKRNEWDVYGNEV